MTRFIGNQRFRGLIETRHAEYSSAPNETKKKIARELVYQIHEVGGRFLKQVETESYVHDFFKESIWIEVETSVALEKCKQALRDLKKQRVSSYENDGRHCGSGEDRSMHQNDYDLTTPTASLPMISASLWNCIAPVAPLPRDRELGDPTSLPMPPLSLTHTLPLLLDEYRLLLQASSSALQEPSMMSQLVTNRYYPSQLNLNYQSPNDIVMSPLDLYAYIDREQQGGLLQDIHRSINGATESVYQNFLNESAIQSLLHLQADFPARSAIHGWNGSFDGHFSDCA